MYFKVNKEHLKKIFKFLKEMSDFAKEERFSLSFGKSETRIIPNMDKQKYLSDVLFCIEWLDKTGQSECYISDDFARFVINCFQNQN